MMKKILPILLGLALLFSLAACAAGPTPAQTGTAPAQTDAAAEKLSVVTTIFPEYDWLRQIVGETDGVELTLLLDRGVDLHSYQPSVDDIVKISTCDLFVYVGGESDEWVEDVLEDATNPAMRVVNLLEVLGDAVKEEELVEGMEAEHDHDHEDEEHEDEEHEEEEGPEYDEHVWLSLKNAAALCRALAGELEALDGANKAAYEINAAAYIEKLEALDGAYAAAVEAGKRRERYPALCRPLPLPLPGGRLRADLLRGLCGLLGRERGQLRDRPFPGEQGGRAGAFLRSADRERRRLHRQDRLRHGPKRKPHGADDGLPAVRDGGGGGRGGDLPFRDGKES